MKIQFVIASLKMGGAERAVTKLAKHWSHLGHDIVITTWADDGEDFYELPPSITRQRLNLPLMSHTLLHKIALQLKRFYAVLRAVKRTNPDIVLPFQTEANILCLATQNLHDAGVVPSERTNIDRQTLHPLSRVLRRITYPRAKQMVFVSKGATSSCPWLPEHRKQVIYNAVEKPDNSYTPSQRDRTIVAIGRLRTLKGFDLLISAFANVAADFPKWRVKIYGDGPEGENLQHQINALHLKDKIEMCGPTHNVHNILSKAGIFVLTSYYEGMPNALIEAMSTGTPCISTDCPHGPNELIQSGYNGILTPVGQIAPLSEALSNLMAAPKVRKQIGDNALEINKTLDIDLISKRWFDVIRNAT